MRIGSRRLASPDDGSEHEDVVANDNVSSTEQHGQRNEEQVADSHTQRRVGCKITNLCGVPLLRANKLLVIFTGVFKLTPRDCFM